MIRATELRKEFGERIAVQEFSFDVGEGEIYGLLGPNGAGKTTTVRMLACLLRPSAGSAFVAGFDVREHPEQVRRRIGLLTEAPGLYLRLTPWEYLDFYGRAYGMAHATRSARIEELLVLVGMWSRRNDVQRGFSKGMQQRVAIARTLLHRPRVLFFDEPTAALDPEAAKNVRDHLLSLAEAEGSTVLLCTHNLDEAERLCNRLSIVHSGRQVAEGTPTQLKAGVERALRLRLRCVSDELLREVRRHEGVHSAEARDNVVLFRTDNPERVNPGLVARLVSQGAEVVSLEEDAVSLEDVYLSVVRKAGEDPDAWTADRRARPESFDRLRAGAVQRPPTADEEAEVRFVLAPTDFPDTEHTSTSVGGRRSAV